MSSLGKGVRCWRIDVYYARSKSFWQEKLNCSSCDPRSRFEVFASPCFYQWLHRPCPWVAEMSV